MAPDGAPGWKNRFMAATPLSRTETLKFNSRWNDKDRAVLNEMLNEFGAETFVPSSGSYAPHVKVYGSGGEHVLDVAKGAPCT